LLTRLATPAKKAKAVGRLTASGRAAAHRRRKPRVVAQLNLRAKQPARLARVTRAIGALGISPRRVKARPGCASRQHQRMADSNMYGLITARLAFGRNPR
jgi:hypothetical protein